MPTAHSYLPAEVSALVHHVALNQAGWADKALSRLVLSALWVSDVPLTTAQLVAAMRRDYNLRMNPADVQPIVSALTSDGHLVELCPDKFRIPD